jgi:hypothetical protein
VNEAHIRDEQTGEVPVMQIEAGKFAGNMTGDLLNSELSH